MYVDASKVINRGFVFPINHENYFLSGLIGWMDPLGAHTKYHGVDDINNLVADLILGPIGPEDESHMGH